MADQKALKKRLKVLMNLPENQVCSDCSERQPRWASLIVPPPGAPKDSLAIGAFCCLECSGSHRRLGVHISFVRSINLDSWKEKEVLAMENGGNAKVNAIFEARLNGPKPNNHADLNTRERFIRDKYERRKFYDPESFAKVEAQQKQKQQQQAAAPQPEAAPQETQFDADFSAEFASSGNVGTPSAAARRRLESRRGPEAAATAERTRPKEPVQQPVVDLLDFSDDPAPVAETRRITRKKSKEYNDSTAVASSTDPKNSAMNDFAAFGSPAPAPEKPTEKAKATSQDIMSLYNTPAPTALYNPTSANQTNPMNNNMTNISTMMQQMNMQSAPPNMMAQNSVPMATMSAQQMQQQAMMYQQHMMRLRQMQAGMNQMPGNMGAVAGMGGNMMMPQQQQMGMMQQQQAMAAATHAGQGMAAQQPSQGNDPFSSLGRS